MKKFLCFLAISSLGASCAFANIGETYQQSCARYGKPHHRHNETVVWFMDNDFSIEASFDDPGNRCDAIAYENFSGSFREDHLQSLIAINIPASEFYREYPVTLGRFWSSTKSRRTALLCIRTGDSGRNPVELSIWTQGHHERVRAAAENNQKSDSQVIPAMDQLPTI